MGAETKQSYTEHSYWVQVTSVAVPREELRNQTEKKLDQEKTRLTGALEQYLAAVVHSIPFPC